VAIPEIVVSASRYEILREVVNAPFAIDQRAVVQQPDFGDDPLRALQRLPGMAAGGASAKTHTRGGTEDETAIVLNGQRLLDPFHIRDYQSLFSAIDARAVDGIEVYAGGFPARYGDRIGGLVLIDALNPEQPRHTEFGLSVFNTSVLSAGTIGQGTGDWLVSARRGNLDRFVKKELGKPTYSDFFGELGVNFSASWRTIECSS
jgi:outer membrane receptor protein involved in Fe transport